MATAVVEVERKYETNPDAPAPDVTALTDLPPDIGAAGEPVTDRFALSAVYYDTPGLDLAAAHLTLRRREGGDDAGWHLKLPAGPDTRTELHLPLAPTDAGVPAEFTALLRAATRHTTLRPVATIDTDRTRHRVHDTTGRLLAELTLDRVTATDHRTHHAQHWTEVEVELAAGPHHLLDLLHTRLLAAGLRPASTGSKLARALNLHQRPATPARRATAAGLLHHHLGEQLATLIRQDIALRRDQPDAAPAARATARRIRAVLRVFAPILDPAATAPLTAGLRRLEHRLRADAAAALDADDYPRLLDGIANLLTTPPTDAGDTPATTTLPPLVRAAFRRVHRHLRRHHPTRARRAAHRARYALDVIAPLRPHRTARVAAAVTAFTDHGPRTDTAWRAIEHTARPLWRRH